MCVGVSLSNLDRFTKESFWRRDKTKKGMSDAVEYKWGHKWTDVFTSRDAEGKAEALVMTLDKIMDNFFKKITIKSTDDPWGPHI